jgi:hypothetical protein
VCELLTSSRGSGGSGARGGEVRDVGFGFHVLIFDILYHGTYWEMISCDSRAFEDSGQHAPLMILWAMDWFAVVLVPEEVPRTAGQWFLGATWGLWELCLD